jgi:hypothetical protein
MSPTNARVTTPWGPSFSGGGVSVDCDGPPTMLDGWVGAAADVDPTQALVRQASVARAYGRRSLVQRFIVIDPLLPRA